MNPTEREGWWMGKARRVRMRVNTGWWLDLFLPTVLLVSVAGAGAILMARRDGQDLGGVLFALSGTCLVAALVCLLVALRRFESVRDGLVRLEATHRLRNRLTAAADGVGEWPAMIAVPSGGLAWAWQRSLWHPMVAAGLLLAAVWFPVRPAAAEASGAVEEPLAWSRIEEWIQVLEEEQVVDEAALRKLREQVQQLRAQPMEEWYSHSSLEAGDSLHQQTEQSLRELERSLQAARSALAGLEPYEDAMPLSMREAWEKFMGQSLAGLKGPMLPIDPSLLSRLEGIDPSRLRQLTPEELKALMDALARGELACKKCNGSCTGTNCVAVATATSWCSGGISRGPGEAPLFMKENETQLGTTAMETLQNPNFERASLGDTLAVGQTEHEIDETLYQGPQSAGAVASAGEGGETVWRNPLPPDEQDVLKRYFK